MPSSIKLFQENIRPSPVNGFIRFRSGTNALAEKTQAFRKNGGRMEARTNSANSGEKTISASSEISSKRGTIMAGSCICCGSKEKALRAITMERCINQLPIVQKVAPAVIKTRNVPSSRECGTCPFSRACSNRLPVGSSVFSRSLSSAIAIFWS